MKGISLIGSKVILAFCNFLLLACGCTLITGGLLLLFDSERVLLSRLLSTGHLGTLTHPLLYYAALGFAALGLIILGAGVLGCWASCLQNYCTLTVYFLIIMLVLVGECAIYAIGWAWPNCLGLNLEEEELIKTLQRNYGVAGQEQFTAAFDLAQTTFSCCGVVSANEYDTSLWRLQALGPGLAVPLTCCKLENFNKTKGFLNPQPTNLTLCQALETERQQGFRHNSGCIDHLEQWYKQQYVLFLAIGLVAVLIEFSVLLSVIFAFTKLYKHRHSTKEVAKTNENAPKIGTISENIYQRRSPLSYTNQAYTMSNSFRQNYKLVDKA